MENELAICIDRTDRKLIMNACHRQCFDAYMRSGACLMQTDEGFKNEWGATNSTGYTNGRLKSEIFLTKWKSTT